MGKRLDVLIERLREDVEYTLRRYRSAPEGDKSFWHGAHATALCAVEWAEMARRREALPDPLDGLHS